MVEACEEGPGMQLPVMDLAVVETQTEPKRHKARVTQQVWRAKVELTALRSQVEVGNRKTVVEPLLPSTTAEPRGSSGMRDHGSDKGAWSQGGTDGSKGRAGLGDWTQRQATLCRIHGTSGEVRFRGSSLSVAGVWVGLHSIASNTTRTPFGYR